jgi:hypothetical protein
MQDVQTAARVQTAAGFGNEAPAGTCLGAAAVVVGMKGLL